MANPHGPVVTTGIGTTEPPIPPFDPEEFREIQLLAEAVLVSFTATPNPLAPYGHATLAWDIAMPTTVIPGVHVEVHLYRDGDQMVDPHGSQVVGPYGEATYTLSLRTRLAARQLGTLNLAVDFGTCTSVDTAAGAFTAIVTGEADKAFPAGGQVSLRGNGSSVDIGYNAFVVDIPLTASVDNWFDADVDVSLGFSVFSENGQVRVTHDFADTDVSFGVASSILSVGCSAAVAAALEAQSDGFLSGFVGPVVADRIRDSLNANIKANLDRLNDASPPVPLRFYGLTLTIDGLSYRFCPAHPAPVDPTRPPTGGGNHPIHQ